MPIRISVLIIGLLMMQGCSYHSHMIDGDSVDRAAFEDAINAEWQGVFFDSCDGDWRKRWFLDGEVASVRTSGRGMQLTAGPRFGDDAHHMVLWTIDSFAGDLLIDYEYTKLDFETNCVSILYIQATGSDELPFGKDIRSWSDLRKVPAMSMYHQHMNLYHISYAAFPNRDDQTTDYVRARRYMPESGGLGGTDLVPDYENTGLFQAGVKHRVTLVKRGQTLSMRISNGRDTRYFHWQNEQLPPVDSGRIGLRQMYTRSALISKFSVKVLEPN